MRTFVLLPTYNEAGNLVRLVEALRGLGLPLHLVVVDDASPDGTGRVAESLAAGHRDLTLIRREGARGYGKALAEGFGVALREGAEAVLTMDCDFSHDPGAVPSLVAALAEADVVVGSRYTAGGAIRDWPLHRRFLSASANAFVRVLFRLPARDGTSGFRIYRRRVLERLPWESFHSTGYSFLVEALYWVSREEGVVIREVPICFAERRVGRSKMGPREIVFGAANLVRLRLELAAGALRAAPREVHRLP